MPHCRGDACHRLVPLDAYERHQEGQLPDACLTAMWWAAAAPVEAMLAIALLPRWRKYRHSGLVGLVRLGCLYNRQKHFFIGFRNAAMAGRHAVFRSRAALAAYNHMAHHLERLFSAIGAFPREAVQNGKPLAHRQGSRSIIRAGIEKLGFDPINFANDHAIFLFTPSQTPDMLDTQIFTPYSLIYKGEYLFDFWSESHLKTPILEKHLILAHVENVQISLCSS
jgi:hypothetical protein